MKAFGARAAGLRLERLRASPLWHDSGMFRNAHAPLPGLRDTSAPRPTLSDFICHAGRRVPAAPLPAVDPREAWSRPAQQPLRATWLGHSTVLLEIDGWRVLTDPVWGPRASPTTLAGPKRFQPVPIALRELPRLDAVVISHDHYDHLDWPTVKALARTPVPFITSLGVGAHLEAFGVGAERITELDWWDSHTVPGTGLTVTAAPSQHFSGRSLTDRNATLWSSMVMAGPRSRVFFSGDTGLTPQYTQIAQRLGPFDLVMLEVGAFHPSWGDIHLGPENALKALQLLGGGAFLPIHWGSFSLALHDWDQPAEVLLTQAPTLGARLLMPRLGEAFEPATAADIREAREPWWRSVEDKARRADRADAAADQSRAESAPAAEAEPPSTAAPRIPKAYVWPAD
ncbi:MAG: MBL fold metallo-hydrolase [Rubrivivax sp.]|nr:MBL fold metallo-hydrolase [Rubrivivax sp.]